jgi:bisphosphoglycerate-dependent phosphoglycerate mutase
MSGGGKQPSSTTQTQDLPAWARPYAKDVLAKGAALTDIEQNPYQLYEGERTAGFSPLQQQSFQNASTLGYDPVGQQYTGANVGQYMNPYLQEALAPQLREAASAGMQAQNMNAAKAVGQGAFGGTRGALQQSLTEKNVLQNMADINAKGYGDAFNQAAGMFNQDQARRIQEAQYGAQYGMDVNKLQNTYGQQQQALAQKQKDIDYQTFVDQKNYAQNQLGFMSDLVRGTPTGSSSTTKAYGGSGDPLTTVAGLGAIGKGAGMFKKGGSVKSKKASGLGVLAMHKIAKG